MVIVTGATGHIGNVLVRELASSGIKVKALVPESEDISHIKDLNIEIIRADILDLDSLIKNFSGAETVFHLAGIVFIGTGKEKLLYEINVSGTKKVVEASIKTGVKRLVYTSSIHAFIEPPKGSPIVETKHFDPDKILGHYAKSKAQATIEVLKGIEKGLDAVIVHPTGVIGPYDYKTSNMGQLIKDFINKKLFAYIDGAYDFVDVRDVAKGIILAAEKGEKSENYILSGEQITVKDILNVIEKETGIPAPRLKIPNSIARLFGPLFEVYASIKKQKPLFTSYSVMTLNSNSLTSHEKATKELGYNPRPVRESIKDAVSWFKSNKII